MDSSAGVVTAQLVASKEDTVAQSFADEINETIKPQSEVLDHDVHVRAMWVVSDETNSFGGRFPAEEHETLARLLVDSPVLVGHRKDSLPVGRAFSAEVVERDGRSWVRALFYWLSDADGAETMRANIDRGIIKECSISFTFLLPECSVCGEDIRRCPHQPGETYGSDDTRAVCCFNYRQIQSVLETSLVYRGANPGTKITAAPSAVSLSMAGHEAREYPEVISRLSELDPRYEYSISPAYEGIGVLVKFDSKTLEVTDLDSRPLDSGLLSRFDVTGWIPGEPMYGMLVGCRGRSRCSQEQLRAYMCGLKSSVSRLELQVASDQVPQRAGSGDTGRFVVRPMRIQRGPLDTVVSRFASLATKSGVWVHRSDTPPPEGGVSRIEAAAAHSGAWWLYQANDAFLSVLAAGRLRFWRMPSDAVDSMGHGRLFLADEIDRGEVSPHADLVASGETVVAEADKDCEAFSFSGDVAGTLQTFPARVHGRDRSIVRWHVDNSAGTGGRSCHAGAQ